eukprot:GILJ01004406.1.p1 GENE.GILJ01004406.1~~GILJ01004406.1.p1  ORF type:complete len:756 (+),score=130.86 GILJ01004406.1:400-2667(+)
MCMCRDMQQGDDGTQKPGNVDVVLIRSADKCSGEIFGCPGNTYELQEELGRGAAGVVKRCRHTKTSQQYAVKLVDLRSLRLRPHFELEKKKLSREAEVLMRLKHPNIVNLIDVFETRDMFYLVMDLVQGGDLFDKIISKTRLDEVEARHIFVQTLQAVQYMHSKGVLHRDLKPENILLTRRTEDLQYEVKVADFGLAKFMGTPHRSQPKTFVGTPQYYAPEVITAADQGEHYGAAADCWSLGVLLYVMLAGSFPFLDNAGHRIESLVKLGVYSLEGTVWKCISAEAKQLIAGLMTVDPKCRFSVDQCMQHPWVRGTTFAEGGPFEPFLLRNGSSSQLPACTPSADVEMESRHNSVQCEPSARLVLLDHRSAAYPSTTYPTSQNSDCQNDLQIQSRPESSQLSDRTSIHDMLNLHELSELQTSIAHRLQLAYIAFQNNSELAGRIRFNSIACRELHRKAQKVVRKFEQTSSSVLSMVIPDLRLAVEEKLPDLISDSFNEVKSWVTNMKDDAQTIQKGYTQIMFELNQTIESAKIIHSELAAPPALVTQAMDISTDSSILRSKIVQCLSQSQIALTAEDDLSNLADNLIDILFAVPDTASSQNTRGSYQEETDGGSTCASVSSSPLIDRIHSVSDIDSSPQPSSSRSLWRAVEELRKVDSILSKCTDFWSMMEIAIDAIAQKKEHTQQLLGYVTNPRVMQRFLERLSEYEQFWNGFRFICRQYVAESYGNVERMYRFLSKGHESTSPTNRGQQVVQS